jgi:hypothetical protein
MHIDDHHLSKIEKIDLLVPCRHAHRFIQNSIVTPKKNYIIKLMHKSHIPISGVHLNLGQGRNFILQHK